MSKQFADLEIVRDAIKELFPEISKQISVSVIDGIIQGLKDSKREAITIGELELFRKMLLPDKTSKESGSP